LHGKPVTKGLEITFRVSLGGGGKMLGIRLNLKPSLINTV